MRQRYDIEDRVAKLRESHKLDTLVPPLVSNSQGLWSLWLDVVPWFGVVGLTLAFIARRPIAGLALTAVTALLFGFARLMRPAETRIRKRVLQRGVLTRAQTVMVNDQWFEEGNREPWPGFLLLSFHAPLAHDGERMQELARRLFALKNRDRSQMPPELALVAWTLYQEMNCERVAVPAEFAGAPDTWICSAMFPPDAEDDDGGVWLLALRGETHPAAAVVLPRAVTQSGASSGKPS